MPQLFLTNVWIGLAFWAVLYISDYTLTIVGARLYQGVREKITFEGSYELNPYFQRDVNALRTISPRFVVALVLSSAWLCIVWILAQLAAPQLYVFALGTMISLQLCVHVRHIRNISFFRIVATDAVRGRIEYSKWATLRNSAVEMLSLSGLFVVLFVFTGSRFLLGGVLSCSIVAAKHNRYSKKYVSPAPVLIEEATVQ